MIVPILMSKFTLHRVDMFILASKELIRHRLARDGPDGSHRMIGRAIIGSPDGTVGEIDFLRDFPPGE